MGADGPSIRIDAELEQVRDIAHFVRHEAAKARLDEVAMADLELAVVEAANNIILHGYRGARGPIRCVVGAEDGRVSVMLIDSGSPIPAEKLERRVSPSELAESGRGLSIIYACVDSLDYASDDGENRLTLSKAG